MTYIAYCFFKANMTILLLANRESVISEDENNFLKSTFHDINNINVSALANFMILQNRVCLWN